MAEVFRLAQSDMSNASGTLRSRAGDMDATIVQIGGLVKSLVGADWQGDSAAAFEAKFEEVKKGLNIAKENVEGMAQLLDAAAAYSANADSDLASKIAQL